MMRSSSYYELFGVSRSATSDEIRAAYVGLMKRYHPDAAGNGDPAADHMVTVLNRCYAVLKDPLKRAEYDAELLLKMQMAQSNARRRQVLIVQPNKAVRMRSILLVLGIPVAAVALATGLSNDRFEESGLSAGNLLGWSATVPSSAVVIMGPLKASDVAQTLRLATSVSSDQALLVSKHCFDAARAEPNPGSARLCIIFDDAFLYWRQNASNYTSLPIYFHDEFVRMRHLNALAATGEESERELNALRDVTFRGLLAQLTRDDGTQAQSPTPAQAPNLDKAMSRNGAHHSVAISHLTGNKLNQDESVEKSR